MDSWEKIERDLLACRDWGHYVEIERFADRLRALREQDEKRWEIVREVEGDIRTHAETYDQAAMSRTTYSEFWFGEADRLRAAREGK